VFFGKQKKSLFESESELLPLSELSSDISFSEHKNSSFKNNSASDILLSSSQFYLNLGIRHAAITSSFSIHMNSNLKYQLNNMYLSIIYYQ